MLLAALADAAAGDDLSRVRQAATAPVADSDLAALAATFAALARRGAAEGGLAVAVLRDVRNTPKGGRHDLAGTPERRLRPGGAAPVAPDRTAHRQGLGVGRGLGRRDRRCRVDSGVDAAHPAVGAVDRASPCRGPETEEVTARGPARGPVRSRHGLRGIIRRAAPDATLWSVRVLGSRLTGKGVVFAAGLRWAIAQGARVVNLSLSTGREDYFGLFHEIADEAAFAA